jgi:capsular exopolysaccharide synthesis family protein
MAEPLAIDEHLVGLLAPTSFEAEQYRTLAHTIESAHKGGNLRVLAVTSPTSGDGKTTTAINLAGTLAQASDARVLLICADLRKPSIIEHLGMENADSIGLATALLNPEHTLMQVAKRLEPFNLSVVPSGPSPDNLYEVLKSPRFGELLHEAKQLYDHIVIDTPPLLLVPDCRLIEKWIDGFLLVVASHKTPRRLVEDALDLMDPSRLIGFVFNYDDRALPGYYNYYYYGSGRPSLRRGRNWWQRATTALGHIFPR